MSSTRPIGKCIDEIVGGAIARELKSHRFRRKGRTFHRASEDGIALVTIQASRHGDGLHGSFTVNVGVHFPALHTPIHGTARGAVPTIAECMLGKRLGMLTATPHDEWYEVDGTTELAALSERVAETLRTRGVPWLDAHATLRLAYPTFDEASRLGPSRLLTGMAAALVGDDVRARAMLQKLVDELGPEPGQRQHVLACARAVGIRLADREPRL